MSAAGVAVADPDSSLDAQDVAARTHALSLLKSKLQRTRGSKQSSRHAQAALNSDASAGSANNHVMHRTAAGANAAAASPDEAKAAVPIDDEQPESCSPARPVSAARERNLDLYNNNDEHEPTIAQLKQRMAPAVVLEPTRRSMRSRPHSREHKSCTDAAVPAPLPLINSSTLPHTGGSGSTNQEAQEAKAALTKLVVKWSCTTCKRECIPIREESRCLWCVRAPSS